MIEKILERARAELFNLTFHKSERCKGFNDGIHTVMKIIQEESKNGGWIPCSERLPEENDLTHYEITFINSFDKPYRSVAMFSKCKWYMPGTNCRDYDWFPYEVIAWKEPSAPYQKGE